VFISAAFLVLGNSAIIAKMLKRSAILGQQINSQHGIDVTKMTSMTVMFVVEITKMTSMTVMFVVESLLFLLLNVPWEIVKIDYSLNLVVLGNLTLCQYDAFRCVSILLVFVSPSLNFLLYMVAGGKFRTAFRETFGGLLRSNGVLASRAWRRISERNFWSTEVSDDQLCPEREAAQPLNDMTSPRA
jgi:hypothetical protein